MHDFAHPQVDAMFLYDTIHHQYVSAHKQYSSTLWDPSEAAPH